MRTRTVRNFHFIATRTLLFRSTATAGAAVVVALLDGGRGRARSVVVARGAVAANLAVRPVHCWEGQIRSDQNAVPWVECEKKAVL